MWGRVENGSDVHRLPRAEGKATAPARSGTSASHGCRHHKWLDPQSRAAIVRLTGREADIVLYPNFHNWRREAMNSGAEPEAKSLKSFAVGLQTRV